MQLASRQLVSGPQDNFSRQAGSDGRRRSRVHKTQTSFRSAPNSEVHKRQHNNEDVEEVPGTGIANAEFAIKIVEAWRLTVRHKNERGSDEGNDMPCHPAQMMRAEIRTCKADSVIGQVDIRPK